MISYDLETCLMKKGKSRKDVLILSIGAVDLIEERKFHCYVNPLGSAKATYMHDLENYGVRVKPTNTVMTNIHWRHEKAIEVQEALEKFDAFVNAAKPILGKVILVAHNGRSFDHKILRGTYERANCRLPDFAYLDSWHDITKKGWPKQRSHKLQDLHRSLCCNSLLQPKWHQSLDDAEALAEIIYSTAIEETAKRPRQAWSYARNHVILEQLNKNYAMKLSPELRLCKRSQRAWPDVVRKSAVRSKELRLFCLEFCIKQIWQRYLR